MNRKKSFRNIFLSLLIVTAIVATGAIAYLTGVKTVNNTFEVGEAEIELIEPNWKPDADKNNDGTMETWSSILPNETFTKDPTVVNKGSTDVYAYVMVSIPKVYSADITTQNENGEWETETKNHYPLFSYTANPGWKLVAEQKGTEVDAYDYAVYAYENPLVPESAEGEHTATLFDDVTFANITSDFANVLTGKNIVDLSIGITAYAIQSDFYAGEANGPEEAWQLYVNQNGWEWPSTSYEGLATLTYHNYENEKIYEETVYNGTPVMLYYDSSLARNDMAFNWVNSATGETLDEQIIANGDMIIIPDINPLPPNIIDPSVIIYETQKDENGKIYLSAAGLDHNNAKYSNYVTKPLSINSTVTFEVPQTQNTKISTYANTTGTTIYSSEGTIKLNHDISAGTRTLEVRAISSNAFANETAISKVLCSGNNVTSIGSNAFYKCTYLTDIEMPYMIESIGNNVFEGCKRLTSIKISERVTYLGNGVFKDCTVLKTAKLPSTLDFSPNNIGDDMFYNCTSLTTTNIPDMKVIDNGEYITVGAIGDYAFYNCQNLTNVDIPESVDAIGNYAFYNCKKITEVDLTESLTYLGDYAFENCSNLQSVGFANNMDYIGYGAFKNCSSLVEALMRYGPTSILAETFSGCSSLEITLIPLSVNAIEDKAYYGCSSLHSIASGAKVGWVGEEAFRNCSSLRTIPQLTGISSISNYSFYGCSSLISIPFAEKLKSIPDYAFYNCTSLLTIDLSKATSIGSRAFMYCDSIDSANVPNATSIGTYAFAYCDSLKSIEISNNIKTIGSSAFYNCNEVKKLSVPATIVMTPFETCINIEELTVTSGMETNKGFTKSPWDFCKTSLNKVIVADNVEYLGFNVFLNLNNVTEVSFPVSLKLHKEALLGCNNIKSVILTQGTGNVIDYDGSAYSPIYAIKNTIEKATIDNAVTKIGKNYFSSCALLNEVVFSDNMTSISESAFSGCKSLVSLDLGKNITEIEKSAFSNCTALTEVVFGPEMKKIGANAFYNCTNLNVLDFNEGLEEIGVSAFKECKGITNITLPKSLKVLNENAFYNCSNITEVIINCLNSEFKDGAFYNCSNVKKVNFAGSIVEWCNYNFESLSATPICSATDFYINNERVDNLVIPEGVTNINSYTFPYCSEDISFPDSLKTIGDYAFYGCDVSELNLPNNLQSIGSYAFAYSPMSEIIIPDSVTSLGTYAFYYCDEAEGLIISNSLSEIPENAFSYCTKISTLVIGDSISKIGYRAFYYCSGLKDLTLGKNITDVTGAFGDCWNLKTVRFNGTMSDWCNMLMDDDLLYYQNSLYVDGKLIEGKIVIPDDVTTINDYVFYRCRNITEVELPTELQSIGQKTFYDNDSLTKIYLPESLKSIGTEAFCSSGLVEIYIPGGIEELGSEAFYLCTKLEKAEVGEGINSLPDGIFSNCSVLKELILPASLKSVGGNVFLSDKELKTVNFKGTVEDWCRIDFKYGNSNPLCFADNLLIQGETPKGKIIIPDDVTKICSYLFLNCSEITEIVIPDSVTSINSYAFYNCTGLTNVVIPDSVTDISDYAFYHCDNLKEASTAAQSIGNKSFYGCSNLESVSLLNQNPSLAQGAFAQCTTLKVLTMPANTSFQTYNKNGYSGTETLGSFDGCTNIVKIILTSGALTSGKSNGAPWRISRANSPKIILKEGVTSIGDSSFGTYTATGVAMHGSWIVPDSIKTLGVDAFSCIFSPFMAIPNTIEVINIDWSKTWDLENIYYKGTADEWESANQTAVPTGVTVHYNTEIVNQDDCVYAIISGENGKEAHLLSYVGSNENIIIPSEINETSVTRIESMAFGHHYKLQTISIPNTVNFINEYAFYGCENLTEAKYLGSISEYLAASIKTTGNEPLFENLVIGIEPNRLAYGTGKCGTDANWIVYTDGELVIDGSGDMNAYSSAANVPWSKFGSKIKTITIGNEISSVSNYSFDTCINAETINIPDNKVLWGTKFAACTNVKTINVINNTGSIPNGSYTNTIWYALPETDINIESGIVTIGNYAFYNCESTIHIPETINVLGDHSLAGCTNIDDLSFVNNLKGIGSYAFYGCTQLENITISEEISMIKDYTFYGCTNLETLTIPASVLSIGDNAFGNCTSLNNVNYTGTLTEWCNVDLSSINSNPASVSESFLINGMAIQNEVEIPENTATIKPYTFYEFNEITKLVLPKTVTNISSYAFYNCSSITEIEIPASAKINSNAFGNCSNVKKVFLTNGTNTSTNYSSSTYQYTPWYISRYNIEEVVIESGITNIGNYTFYTCNGLKSIIIPDSVTSIGDYAFYGCRNLTNITIGNNITNIGNSAFYDTAYYNNSNNWIDNVLYVGNYLIKAKTTLSGSYTIKDGTSIVANSAFHNCTSLTSITIPDSVTSINDRAFYYCTGLTSITIGNSATSISNYAFYNCTALTSITLPDGVTSIGQYAFYNCTGLTSVTIGNNVTNIGNKAFYGCSSIVDVYYTDDIAGWCSINFDSTDSNPMYYADNLYIDNKLVTELVIPNSVTSINSCAFYNCTGLTSVTIPDSVTSIGKHTFYNCTGLTSVTIGNNVINIDDYAFSGCSSITDVYYTGDVAGWCEINFVSTPLLHAKNFYISGTLVDGSLVIPESTTSISDYAFYNRTGLTSISICNNVASIGKYAFSGCNGLTSVTIPDSVTDIGSYAFGDCKNIINLTIPASAYSRNYAFKNCLAIEKITITKGTGVMIEHENVPSLMPEYQSYKHTPWFVSECGEVIIENGVTNIGSYTFTGCDGLTSITIPDSVTSIGIYAFSGCSTLADVYYKGTEKEWNAIVMASGNDTIVNATIHFNS